MNPELRRWMLPALLVMVAVDVLLNGVLPVALLTYGHGPLLPAWFQLFIGNGASLLCAIVLADVGYQIFAKHRVTGALLMLVAALGPAMALLGVAEYANFILLIGLAAILALGFGVAVRHSLPMRAYHAMAWLTLCAILGQLYSFGGWASAAGEDTSLIVSLELSAVLASLAVFLAWCTPIKRVSLQTTVVALLGAAGFAAAVALGGHAVVSSVLRVVGVTLFLPLWVYTLCVFLVGVTILTLAAAKEHRIRATALALFAVAGFSFSGSTTVMLSVLSLALLVLSYPARSKSLAEEWRSALAV